MSRRICGQSSPGTTRRSCGAKPSASRTCPTTSRRGSPGEGDGPPHRPEVEPDRPDRGRRAPRLVLATGTIQEFRVWPDEVVERVRLVGQILASGLYRKRVEAKLRATVVALEEKRLEEIRQLKDRLEAENVYLRTECTGDGLRSHRGPEPRHPRRPRQGHPGRADRHLGAAPRRDGHRQGASGPRHPRQESPAGRAPRDRQLRGPAADTSSKASCSATRRAPSRARPRRRRAASSWPTGGRSFSTRSASSPAISR